MKNNSRTIFILVILVMAALLFIGYFFFSDYFTLQAIQSNNRLFKAFVIQHYLTSVVIYISLFGLLLACGMPIGIPFALIGGYLYGIVAGICYAQAGCLLGSAISFIALRYIVFRWIKKWHDPRIETFNDQLNKYGYSYLLMLNFLSIIPMFVINFLAAMAHISLQTIAWVTFVGCFPLNFLCVIAGQRLSSIHSFKEIFSGPVICLLVILALIASAPLFMKKVKGLFGG